METNSELLKLGIFDENMPLTKVMQVAVNCGDETFSKMGISAESQYNSVLLKELLMSLNKEIIKEMNSTEEFLDVMGLSDFDSSDKLWRFLVENRFDFIICPSGIGTIIQNSLLFKYDNYQPGNMLTFYKLGKIGDISVYVDTIKKFDDKTIICGKSNSFKFNYKIDDPVVLVSDTFSKKFVSKLKYELILDKNRFINLHFVNEFNPKYVQINRDKKIDELL